MLLKIMGAEDAPDSDSRKTFQLHGNVVSVDFVRKQGAAFADCVFEDGAQEEFPLPGNAYVMNDAGNTVATFGSASIPA